MSCWNLNTNWDLVIKLCQIRFKRYSFWNSELTYFTLQINQIILSQSTQTRFLAYNLMSIFQTNLPWMISNYFSPVDVDASIIFLVKWFLYLLVVKDRCKMDIVLAGIRDGCGLFQAHLVWIYLESIHIGLFRHHHYTVLND